MIIQNIFNRFKFNNQLIIYKQVSIIIPNNRFILIIHFQRELLFNFYPLLSKPMSQSIFINLFKMTVSQISVNRKTCFSDYVTKFEYVAHLNTPFTV